MSGNVWKTWSPPGAPFPFSTAIFGEGWCFITEAGHDPETGDVPESCTEQARLALQKAALRLAEAGMTLDEVVVIRVCVTDGAYAPELEAVLAQTFSAPLPAAAPLVICTLIDPRLKLEIEVIARQHARRE